MSYIRHNFRRGDKLKASQLNEMEDGIYSVSTEFERIDADQVSNKNRIGVLEADNIINKEDIESLEETVDTKVDKVNPTGSGIVSFGRKDGTTSGGRSVAIGTNVEASGGTSIAIGVGAISNNNNAIAIGTDGIRSGDTEVYHTIASGDGSVAIGVGVEASGVSAVAVGALNKSSGNYSFSAGYTNTASYTSATAMGQFSTASGNSSVAMGGAITTTNGTEATGNSAIALGKAAKSNGRASFAAGEWTIANGNQQIAIGKYNIPDTTHAMIVGNGTDDSNRSNAFTLGWDGTGRYSGDVIINANADSPISMSSMYAKLDALWLLNRGQTWNTAISKDQGVSSIPSGSKYSSLYAVSGKCSQDIKEGYNLLDFADYSSDTQKLTNTTDLEYIGSTTLTMAYPTFRPANIDTTFVNGREYTITIESEGDLNVQLEAAKDIDLKTYKHVCIVNGKAGTTTKTFTYARDAEYPYLFVQISSLPSDVYTGGWHKARFMFEEGSEVHSFEPYVGHTHSPNHDYPQPVHQTTSIEVWAYGDNMVDMSELENGMYNAAGTWMPNVVAVTTAFIPVYAGEQFNGYIFNGSKSYIGRLTFSLFDKNKNFVSQPYGGSYVTIPDNVRYIRASASVEYATYITSGNYLLQVQKRYGSSVAVYYEYVGSHMTIPVTLNAVVAHNSTPTSTIDGVGYVSDVLSSNTNTILRYCGDTTFNGSESWSSGMVDGVSYFKLDVSNLTATNSPMMSDQFIFDSTGANTGVGYATIKAESGRAMLYVYYKEGLVSSNQFKQALAEKPMHITYCLKELVIEDIAENIVDQLNKMNVVSNCRFYVRDQNGDDMYVTVEHLVKLSEVIA